MSTDTAIAVRDLRVRYGATEVIHGISFEVHRGEILGVIGPAQSGKTSMLRCLNRTLEFTPGARMQGVVEVNGEDVARTRDVYALRRTIGMVAPLPVGLPLSIYDNVAFAPRAAGLTARASLDELVERCLVQAVLCLDEFSIAIDPVTTMRIEDVLKQLKAEMTIVLVTNLTQQARRLADRTMFLLDGEIVEIGATDQVFSRPADQRTGDYVNGIFG
jgi:phosphate transport system ATP-binding protein